MGLDQGTVIAAMLPLTIVSLVAQPIIPALNRRVGLRMGWKLTVFYLFVMNLLGFLGPFSATGMFATAYGCALVSGFGGVYAAVEGSFWAEHHGKWQGLKAILTYVVN